MKLKKGETRLTPELLDQIKQLSDQGLGQRKISKQLQISGASVRRAYQILKPFGLDLDSKKFILKLTPEVVAKVKVLYESGLGCLKIARAVNLSIQSISNVYKQLGYDTSEENRHRPRKLTPVFLQKVQKLCEAGLNNKEIAKKLKVRTALVANARKKLKIDNIYEANNKAIQTLLPKIKELYHQGIGYKRIAKLLNLSEKRVLKTYKSLGFAGIKRQVPRTVHLLTHKICIDCKNDLPVNQFRKRIHKNNLFYFESRCFDCEKKYTSKKNHENYANSPTYRLRNRVSTMIREALHDNNSSKNNQSFLQYIDWTIQELKTHLENQFEDWMTWKNQGRYYATRWNDNDPATWTWQIDHIIPQSDLPYTSMKDDNFKKCWSLENLRPLSAKQNNYDGVYRTRHRKNK